MKTVAAQDVPLRIPCPNFICEGEAELGVFVSHGMTDISFRRSEVHYHCRACGWDTGGRLETDRAAWLQRLTDLAESRDQQRGEHP